MPDKAGLVRSIIASLEADLAAVSQQAESAHAAATHEESTAENKYDTFGLEAGYLAAGLLRRVAEIRAAIQAFRIMPVPDLGPDDSIRLGALVTLDDHPDKCYFIGPGAAGLMITFDDAYVRVITPQSPIGQALMEKFIGDEVEADRQPWSGLVSSVT